MPFAVVPYFKRDLKQASICSLLFWCGLSSVCVEMNTFASDNKQCRLFHRRESKFLQSRFCRFNHSVSANVQGKDDFICAFLV